MNNNEIESGESSDILSIDIPEVDEVAHRRLHPLVPVSKPKPHIKTNENEDESLYRDMTCSVCYSSMADLAEA